MKTKLSIFLLVTLFLASCQKQALNLPVEGENNLNLNSLLTLAMGENIIHTQDFILNPSDIDSVSSPEIPVNSRCQYHLD